MMRSNRCGNTTWIRYVMRILASHRYMRLFNLCIVLQLSAMFQIALYAQNNRHPFLDLGVPNMSVQQEQYTEKEDSQTYKHSARVLYISSYHPTFTATKAQIDGLMSVVDTMGVEISMEFMDTKRYPNDTVQVALFRKYLAHKLKIWPTVDAVVVGDDNAFLFALKEQNGLFKDQPIVFAGVNDKRLALKQNENPKMTGVIEQTSMDETIRQMIALKPEAKKIYVLTDSTTTAQLDFNLLMETSAQKFPHHEFVEVNMCFYSMAAYRGMLNRIPASELILLISGYRDRFLHPISLSSLLRMIRQYTRTPVFHLWDHGVGDGLVGGRVVSPYRHGQLAGQLLRKILSGTPVSDIPVIYKDVNINMYDWEIIQRYNIDARVLPKDTVFVNKPVGFFTYHARALVISGLIMLVLLLVIVYLQQLVRNKKNQAEKMMLRACAAEQADKLKSMFLANMSHEIRTPLNAIVGFSSLMVDGELSDKERQEYFELIVKNNDQLLNLIGDILDLAKLQSGTMKMTPEVFEIKAFIERLFVSLSHLSKSSKVKVVLDVDDQPSFDIYFDSKRLMQVISNFMTNALKFTEKGEVRLYYRLEDRGAVVCVHDTGVGIPLDKQDKVFQRFEKLDQHTRGTGLGLSISSAIMEQEYGRIGFESTPGKGSTFWCWVPSASRKNEILRKEAKLNS